MLRLFASTGAVLVCAIADVPSCQQADETTLLQGFVRHRHARSLQPNHLEAAPLPHSNVQFLEFSRQTPNPLWEAVLQDWAAQNPILALKIGEVPPDEVASVIIDAGFGPAATNAIDEFIDEHGGAAFQEWVRGVLSPQFSYPEPDLPDFTEPTELKTLVPITSHPNRLYTQVLDETIYGDVGGRFMDGSMAHYYYRQGAGDILVLHQDGGGSCGTDEHAIWHCNLWFPDKQKFHRENGPGGKGTGPRKPFVDGNFRGNVPAHLDDNHPDFGSAHKIRVPCLTGDSYLGQVFSPANPCRSTFAPDGSYEQFADFNTCDQYTSGHLVLRNIMHHFLSNQPGSRNITRIFLTGASAGGRSTLMHCDWLQEFMDTYGPRLGMQHVEVGCVSLAGFGLPTFTADHEDPRAMTTPFPLWRIGEATTTEEEATRLGTALLLGKYWLPRACRAALAGEEVWRCGAPATALPYMTQRVFLVQNKYDHMTQFMSFPMKNWGWSDMWGPAPEEDASKTCEGQFYMRYYGDAMEASMDVVAAKPRDGMFFASCIDHHKNFELGGEAVNTWTPAHVNTLVQGVDSLQAVTNWFFERGELPNVIRDDCQSPMGVPCNEFCQKFIRDRGNSCL